MKEDTSLNEEQNSSLDDSIKLTKTRAKKSVIFTLPNQNKSILKEIKK